jgi:hypothetical protein
MPIGIDPDLSGALVVLDAVGALVALCDTPVLHLPMARGRGRHEYDVLGLVALLMPYAGPQTHVLLEETQAHARPRGTLDVHLWARHGGLTGPAGGVASPDFSQDSNIISQNVTDGASYLRYLPSIHCDNSEWVKRAKDMLNGLLTRF